MSINRKELKRDARQAMREHKPSIYLITVAFLVITAVLEVLSVKLQFPGMKLLEIIRNYASEEGMRHLLEIGERQSYFGSVLDFAITIMSSVLAAGFTLSCLCVVRRQEASVGTLLDPFAFLLKVVWMNIVTSVFCFLWSLLLLFPGIIAAYRYSMAIYILLDDPSKSVMQCIRESKAMTYGYKMDLFVLDLSFLGWILLSVIPLVSIYTMPYMETAHAEYYNVLCGWQNAEEAACDPWVQ